MNDHWIDRLSYVFLFLCLIAIFIGCMIMSSPQDSRPRTQQDRIEQRLDNIETKLDQLIIQV